MKRLNTRSPENERQRSRIGSQLPEEFYDYLDKQDLIRNDRFLKRFGKRLLSAIRLRRNQSNVTLLDSEIDSNFSLSAKPRRTFSLHSERTLLSRKKSLNREDFIMEDLEVSNRMLSERRAKDDEILLHDGKMTVIELAKENGGFGFNIVGGIDREYIPGDPGIFISVIRNGSSASRDRRLKIGDRIVSVNGVLLAGKTHNDAMQIFQNTKGTAVFVVEQDAESRVLHKPTELSGIPNSDESVSSSKSEQRSLSPSDFATLSSKSLNTSLPSSLTKNMSRVMQEPTEVREKKRPLSPPKKDGKDMMNNETENRNEVYLTEQGQILEIGSVTTASPLTQLKDETETFDGTSEGAISLNNDENNVVDDEYDYEKDENASISCNHSNSIIDDVPITPKKPYRLLDPSNPSVFNEVLAVSAGVAALGVGIYVVYKLIHHRSSS